jgi:hypothetical protein
MLYGTATFYEHLAVGAPDAAPPTPTDKAFLGALDAALGGQGGADALAAGGRP